MLRTRMVRTIEATLNSVTKKNLVLLVSFMSAVFVIIICLTHRKTEIHFAYSSIWIRFAMAKIAVEFWLWNKQQM